jgi:hypothetical protein
MALLWKEKVVKVGSINQHTNGHPAIHSGHEAVALPAL